MLRAENARAIAFAPERSWPSSDWLRTHGLSVVAEGAERLTDAEAILLIDLYKSVGARGVVGLVHESGYEGTWGFAGDLSVEDVGAIVEELSIADFVLMPIGSESPALIFLDIGVRQFVGTSEMIANFCGLTVSALRDEFMTLSDPSDAVMATYREIRHRMDW